MTRNMHRFLFALTLVFVAGAVLAADLPDWARDDEVSVQWRPWDEQTLAAARAGAKSVYVFVAPEQSELARATLAQTFSRKETADWLNDNFVCVFVDADLRPDVAAYMQHYLATVKQAGGWPAHIWLTPQLQPYDGANYLPATEEWGRPGFLKSARAALDLWTSDPAGARALADEAVERMRLEPVVAPDAKTIEALLQHGKEAWVAAADPMNGGFGTAPKNPEPETIRFLLAMDGRGKAAALRAARSIVAGGLHDRRSGGFHRRTLDAEWTQPHRQKTLLDQARVALALFAAADAGGEGFLRDAGLRALDFACTDLRRSDGSWAVSADEAAGDGGVLLRGRAGPALLGVVVLALARSGSPGHQERARELASAVRETLAKESLSEEGPMTVHDYLAVSAALAAVGERDASLQVREQAEVRYLDRSLGCFMTHTGESAAGVRLTAPALAEPFRAEAFALMHDIGIHERTALRGRLCWIVEYDPLPAGEILLALLLSQTAR